jgi:hypothetical protein
MYWNVPRTVPCSVSGFWTVWSAGEAATALDFARPKSSSFAPLFVTPNPCRRRSG